MGETKQEINKDFITKDDEWGIRKTLKDIFSPKRLAHDWMGNVVKKEEAEMCFNIFFNQFLPPAYRETKSTVIRHVEEIRDIIKNKYEANWVWLERNGGLSCDVITDDILRKIQKNEIRLPLYLEIEEEKKKWQAKPQYRKDEGFSDPIKEEYVQLNLRKK
jgi:hypothetical protein